MYVLSVQGTALQTWAPWCDHCVGQGNEPLWFGLCSQHQYHKPLIMYRNGAHLRRDGARFVGDMASNFVVWNDFFQYAEKDRIIFYLYFCKSVWRVVNRL